MEKFIIELTKIKEFVGPFTSETEAYAYADKWYGELNSDEFEVWPISSAADGINVIRRHESRPEHQSSVN